ncbi:hypothetical protein [Marinomonas algarum]|uniref:Peptidoglycan-binding protein CsiV n=1 Tax=Marinomonas algarum TaxID=2883105 RepID=A0A9X1IR01_9GAMM|nr:hypothetical protein [Marinomonas algarum]MCB5162428.1 hypothetical protein [Marinomonas algarum]
MRAFQALTLLAACCSIPAIGETTTINPDTARAYEGYLVTFMWPDGQTKEQVDYDNLYSTDHLPRFADDTIKPGEALQKDKNNSSEINELLSTPLDNAEQKLARHVTVLSKQQWTLIFKAPGDTIRKSFHSEQKKDGYPELTGDIAITLGRYLESDIHYQHYLFDSFSQPSPVQQDTQQEFLDHSLANNAQTSEADNLPTFKEFEPALVLNLHQTNKTASKKVNYLDHPTIATLLYFEPLELDAAIERVATKAVQPETGNSLTYDNLNSTNELNL